MEEKYLEHLENLDKRLIDVARAIKVLSALAWPGDIYDSFVDGWKKGNPKLPQVNYRKYDFREHCAELRRIANACDSSHPIGFYLQQTALSYYLAGKMLECVGTPGFRNISELIYGGPKETLGRSTNLDFAEDFISITDDFAHAGDLTEEANHCVLPGAAAEEFRLAANRVFGPGKVSVVVDDALSAKAAAGAERIRIRGRTSFSFPEIRRLIEHELLVHTVTAVNGRLQPRFKSMGLGSPRTTCTQEGLATFAELTTSTMDLARLRNIGLRIKGIDIACEGADFIEVFRFFRDAGQSEKESFQSASRIFRGADIRGKSVFTKDVVYLKGLFSVHTFLRKAIEQRKIEYPEYLFVGRVSVGDILILEEVISKGIIAKAVFRPSWVENREQLCAYLAYAAFANKLRLTSINLEDFLEHMDPKILQEKDLNEIA